MDNDLPQPQPPGMQAATKPEPSEPPVAPQNGKGGGYWLQGAGSAAYAVSEVQSMVGDNPRQGGCLSSPILQNHPGVSKFCDPSVVSQGDSHGPGRIRPSLTNGDEPVSLEFPFSKCGASVIGLQRVCVIRIDRHGCTLHIELPCA